MALAQISCDRAHAWTRVRFGIQEHRKWRPTADEDGHYRFALQLNSVDKARASLVRLVALRAHCELAVKCPIDTTLRFRPVYRHGQNS
jgi:hypothetical protein